MSAPACRICGAAGPHPRFRAREMMFGTRDPFDYFRCGGCGCLQIETPPRDLSRYYPPDYASLAVDVEATLGRGGARARARAARDRYAVLGRGLAGRLLIGRWPDPALASLRMLGLTPDARVLDVGCGVGLHLAALQRLGFRRLLGVDPFLPGDLFHPPGLHVLRRTVHEVEGEGAWDAVTYHHVLEHVPDPQEQLRSVARLLVPGGACLVRIPVSDSEAWERYGTDWVQLDAPRHFFLHTRRSMERLAADAGLRIERVAHDSTAFQFWGSEQYRRDVPLRSEGEGGWDRGLFPPRRMRAFAREARRLNREGRGDQAVFVLRKPALTPAP